MSVKHEISDALKKIVHGVYVISVRKGERINAMTAAWVARASFDPPLVTVAVGRERFSHGMIAEGGAFAVHVLGADNIEVGKHFGLKSGRKTDKFAGIEYDEASTGSPIIKDCIAWMDCRLVSSMDAGDHTVFIGEVVDGAVREPGEKPIVYERESFFK